MELISLEPFRADEPFPSTYSQVSGRDHCYKAMASRDNGEVRLLGKTVSGVNCSQTRLGAN